MNDCETKVKNSVIISKDKLKDQTTKPCLKKQEEKEDELDSVSSDDDSSDGEIEEERKEKSGKKRVSCPICLDSTLNHSHYGGVCCFSCKAFFRRIVTRGLKRGMR